MVTAVLLVATHDKTRSNQPGNEGEVHNGITVRDHGDDFVVGAGSAWAQNMCNPMCGLGEFKEGYLSNRTSRFVRGKECPRVIRVVFGMEVDETR